jgi:phosphate transport system substrate-binding protein
MGYLSDRTKTISVARRASLVSGEGSATSDEFYLPTVENVLKKTYPLSRPLYLYTNGPPEGIVKLLVDFALGPVGQKQFMDTGFVPVAKETQNPNPEVQDRRQ